MAIGDSNAIAVCCEEFEKRNAHLILRESAKVVPADPGKHRKQSELRCVAAAPMISVKLQLKIRGVTPQVRRCFLIDRIGSKRLNDYPDNVDLVRNIGLRPVFDPVD